MKLLSLLFGPFFFVFCALADDPPASPTNVTVAGGQLMWTPVDSQTDVTYTVQVSSFDVAEWRNVPACVRTTSTLCDVAGITAMDSDGCALLRVRAERAGHLSKPVQACSHKGDMCSPIVNLSVEPGTLFVHLNRNNQLVANNADNAGFRVYHGPEGAPLRANYKDTSSSLTLRGLVSGQRYCVQVGFTLYGKAYGPPSCIRCLLVPHAETSPPNVVLTVVLVLVPVVAVLVATVYVLMFHNGMIKRWLSLNQYHIPTNLTLEPLPADHSPVTFSDQSGEQSEEHFDVISSFTPKAQDAPPP